jgi:hypothetical protein
MRRISSRMTFFYKWIFPVIWFGFLIVFVGIALFGSRRPPPFPFLIVPLAMIGFGYFLMKKLIFDVVDEVWDDSQTLVVKNGSQTERVALSNIKNVNYSPFLNPPQTTFGDQITFCAPVRFIPLTASPVISDLIDRVDQARST